MMRLYISNLLFLVIRAFFSQGVFSPIQQLPDYNNYVLDSVYSTYITKHDKMFLTWSDTTDPTHSQPFFCAL